MFFVCRAYLVGVAGLEDVTGHVGLRVVRLSPQQIREVRQVVAVVDEARDELRFVLEDENRRVVAAGGDAAHEGAVEQQLDLPGLHHGAAAALLAPAADLGHQPRQHGQRGAPVQRAPADVSQGEVPVRPLPLILVLHGDPAGLSRNQMLLWEISRPSRQSVPAGRDQAQLGLVCNSFHVAPHPGRALATCTTCAQSLDRVQLPM